MTNKQLAVVKTKYRKDRAMNKAVRVLKQIWLCIKMMAFILFVSGIDSIVDYIFDPLLKLN